MDNIIHFANVLLLASFLVSDILWLRVLNIAAGAAFILYFRMAMPNALAPVGWNLLFVSINVVQVVRLWLERRPVRLSNDELALYQLAFRTLTPREFARLAAIGTWEEAEPGARLVEQGIELDRVLALRSGVTEVLANGTRVAELKAGQLVGEMAFLSRSKTSAAVVVKERARFLAMKSEELRALFKKHPELRAGVQMAIGNDLIAKLKAA
jgi:Popeye protein conserved region